MTQDELKLALEALKFAYNHCDSDWVQDEKINPAITAIKEALAQEQEPVAWMYQEYRDDDQFGWRDEILFTPPPNDPIYFRNITPVYTHPPQRTEQEPVKIVQYNCKCGRTMKFESVHGVVAPQRTWVGLTGEEQSFVYSNLHNATSRIDSFWVDFANAIEAKLKEKNT